MKIDAELFAASPSEAAELAKKAEEFGFDCLWVNETKHDPFLQLTLAAASTRSIMLGTSIALAFTRSPTTLAYTAWDLQNLSSGRLILGLGSQVKGHIERRFGLKWESPAPKMREVILALRSVWESWQTGSKLDFQGRFYKIDLMTPFFSPGPIEHPMIPIYIAGVNERMCNLVGRLGDGLHVHPLHTARYLKEAILPAMSRGLEKVGRRREDVAVAASVFAAVGDDEAQIKNVRQFYRNQIAFYASTRTYRKVMELHGWGDVCDRLHQLSVRGEWGKMADEVGEEVLDEFVVEGTWRTIGGEVARKYRGMVDRVRFYIPFDGGEGWKGLVEGFPGN
ncbi:MAG: TIGR03617 family F420-dependent LLM class oxidoreductase [Nitrososphaerales archaeon]|nr:TIGR03617 family F420-dependent LLM class oxidoreductase [Nitrososphaerales archaeon]